MHLHTCTIRAEHQSIPNPINHRIVRLKPVHAQDNITGQLLHQPTRDLLLQTTIQHDRQVTHMARQHRRAISQCNNHLRGLSTLQGGPLNQVCTNKTIGGARVYQGANRHTWAPRLTKHLHG